MNRSDATNIVVNSMRSALRAELGLIAIAVCLVAFNVVDSFIIVAQPSTILLATDLLCVATITCVIYYGMQLYRMEKTLIEQGIAAKKVKAEVKKAAVRLWLVYERRIETLRMAFYFIVTVAVRFLLVEFSNLRIAIAATIMIVSAILANKARLALVNYAKLAFPDIDERKDRK